MALRRLLVRGGQSLQLQQQQSSLPALGAAWARQLSGKSTFEDKEHAMEDLYIKKAEEKLLKKLLSKLQEETKPTCEKTAKKELEQILGNVPDDVKNQLMAWKKKDH